MAESAPSPAPAIDWADDTDDEIDFGAPVFSDDDELAPELAKIQADRNYGASKPASPPTATLSSYSSSSGQRERERDSSSPRNIQQSEPLWTSDLRKNAGTMYHEREKLSANNNSRNHGSNASNGSSDRWGKATLQDPDLPYPERPTPSNNSNNDGRAKHSRTQSRGQSDNFPVSPSPPVEKTSARGARGGKGKEQKRRSKDQPGNDDKDGGSEVPWWEQSTYGAKKKEEPAAAPKETPKPTTVPKETPKPVAAPKETPKPVAAPKGSPKAVTPTSPVAKSSAKSTSAPAPEPKEEKPWWEQSTYGAKPKTTATSTNDTPSSPAMKSTTQTGGGQSVADTMARRKALGEKTLTSGVEALTLVSRGDDDSTGSSHSIKNRSVQERVFAEIKAMIARYEDKYGTNKMKPIPPRSPQSEEMDTILESFRKLREGLFATEARDLFSVDVYEGSVLNSLYAGNIPELTKALHHLVQELHPVVYTLLPPPPSSPRNSDNDNNDLLTSFGQIPARRQTFLGLYILHHIAKPPRHNLATVALTENPLFQAVNHPRTGTDELIASFLYLFPLHPQRSDIDRLTGLEPDLRLALEYWTYLRQGNWIGRERLLGTDRTLAGGLPITWAQRLMIRHSMGDSLGTARSLSVATMHKAYYSLPVSVVAQGVGMVEEGERKEFEGVVGVKEGWVEGLKGKYGLAGGVVVRDGVFMFKAKS
ncbi:hypothetical protein EC957_005484 [Mortierella hygrophila]|uniref:Uncharacterized protein n=1 Tax=Mortierella hygrophila TaxID=979708 RepID=A0A9P6FDH9_9FUNG|nr:hypothetical protein EC957_005484 [Mortierella hygrophila]